MIRRWEKLWSWWYNLFTESSFPRLKSWILKYFKVSCRAIEDFTLGSCFQLRSLNICCAKLETLRVRGCFDDRYDWVKVNAPRLVSILWKHNAITASSSLEKLTSLHQASVSFSLIPEYLCEEKLLSVCNLLSRVFFFLLEETSSSKKHILWIQVSE